MNRTNEKSVGATLAQARKTKGWSLDHAAHETKLRRDVISRIEADEFDLLPNPAYARGFVRIYARELGLDSLALLKKLDGIVDPHEQLMELRPEALEYVPEQIDPSNIKRQRIGLIIIVGTLLVCLSFIGLKVYQAWPRHADGPPNLSQISQPINPVSDNQNASPETDEEVRPATPVTVDGETVRAATPVNSTVAPPLNPNRIENAVSAIHDNRLQLAADQDCWVRVIGVRGDVRLTLFEDIIPAGTMLPPSFEQAWRADRFEITLRDAALVNIIFNNENHGKYDKPGRQQFQIPAQ